MIDRLQSALEKFSDFEMKHFVLISLIILIASVIAGIGATKLQFQSDFEKMNPQGIPVMELQNRITDEFSDFSSVVILIQLDENSDINDVRDPEVIAFLSRLDDHLSERPEIQDVASAALFFPEDPQTLTEVKATLNQIPQSSSFFDDAYTFTIMYVTADVGADESKVRALTDLVQEEIDDASPPGGLDIVITGEPPLLVQIFRLIIRDGLFTLIAATIAIFLLLIILQRSLRSALTIIIPPLLGIFWTIGALGWFNIPITIATAATAAMLLGLGVEYSIFIISRYKEEREKHNQHTAVRNAISRTGASTLSSGVTTMIGFFALTLSIFPVLSDLGFTLGIGIMLILLSTFISIPVLVIIEEKIAHEKAMKKKKKEPFYLKIFESYGSLVSRRPYLTILLALIITALFFTGISRINNEEIDFDNTLPQDLPELVAFQTVTNEFGNPTSVNLYVSLDPSLSNSDEPTDIRDPRVIEYVDVLTQKLQYVSRVSEVDSISKQERQINEGRIPQSLSSQKELLERTNWRQFINEDFSATIITIHVFEDSDSYQEEIVSQIYEIIETTEKPAGVQTRATGGQVLNYEFNKFLGPDSSKTALVAFAVIIVFLFLLSRSIKYTILPLVTVIVSIIWILGMIGFFGVPFNSVISSVISMSIGIGIDFGIQLSQRFKQELETADKKTAMKNTLKYTLYPMTITVIAALIGFRAMALGELKLMGDLGLTLSFGIVSAMLVAVSLVAALMVIFERNKSLKTKSQTQKRRTKSK